MKSLPPTLKSWADRARSFAYNCRLWTENNPSQAFGDRKAAASPITDLKQMRRLGNAPIVEVAGLHDLPLHHFRPTEANGVPSEPSERRLAMVSWAAWRSLAILNSELRDNGRIGLLASAMVMRPSSRLAP